MEQKFLVFYSDFLQKFLKPQKPLKVVFDCSNGVAGLILKQLKTKNLKTYFINEKPDGDFPAHGPNPSKPGATKQLQAAVKKYKADLGIIFDADGDRMLCVDDKGRFVDPEISARLLIWHLKPKKVVIDAVTGWLVRKLRIKNSELRILQSKVGQYFIKRKMRSENADFGAERSGHYYFREFFGLDSGIFAAIKIINAVSGLPYKLSDFVDLLPKYFREEIEIGIERIKPADLLEKIRQAYRKEAMPTGRQAVKISHLDGLTMGFSGWWFNLRFSQTEPLLRLNIEATDGLTIKKEFPKLKNLLK